MVTPRNDDAAAAHPHRGSLMALSLGAVGVVYGDIGTSPLYTMKELFSSSHGVALHHDNVLGVLSMVFWSLILVVSLKYVVLLLRADNRGEGGQMALMALALRTAENAPRRAWLITVLAIIGTALFYGDGVVTPAISVLSAIEGLELAAPALHPFVIPLTLTVLVGLFLLQRRGTASVGALFGPVMMVWFSALAVLGGLQVLKNPAVLAAINPWYALQFCLNEGAHAFLALGAVVLAITGAEAIYADMGHFGAKPIRAAWFGFVLPALVLNYFGQGALLLAEPAAVKNPFYFLVPEFLLYPMIALATCATVIASQAVISGAFSVTRQAMQLGLLPRFMVSHTSSESAGQIYMPGVNWLMLAVVIGLVLGFRSSGNLASAYGIAVTGTAVICTVLAFLVMRNIWGWGAMAYVFLVGMIVVDIAFFASCATKVMDGGWFPLVLAALIFIAMLTWRRGRALLAERMKADTMPLDLFITSLFHSPPHHVPGTAIFMTTNPEGVPRALLHNLLHNKVLHERVVLLTVVAHDVPFVSEQDRVVIESLDYGFFKLALHYGFKDEPDVPRALALAAEKGLAFEMMDTTFFLGRETLIPKIKPEMALWREKLFIVLYRNAGSAADYFKIPVNRVVEFGTQVEL
ncbi:MAG: hypothetical protein RIR70_353 [Pseudomonadota bacterium]|jgi:KUP system potassium uptake protein